MTDISDEMLRSIDAIAIDVDRLAVLATDAESRGRLSARRQRLLIELDSAGVFDRGNSLRTRLVALDLTKLVEYRDAASAMWRYLESPARTRVVKTRVPARLVDSDGVAW